MSRTMNNGTGHVFKSGWAAARMHWKTILVCLVANLFIAFIAMGPLSNVFKEALSNTSLHDKLSEGFDYTIVSDILREYKSGISVSTTLILSLFVPMFLWSIFCSGGFMALVQQYPKKADHNDFWRGGAYYFFRYLRLSLFCLLIMFLIGSITFSLVAAGGLNPLMMDSEGPIITKFYVAIIITIILYFFLDLFKELSKVFIAKSDNRWFTLDIHLAFRNLFQKKNILLAVYYAITLVIITGIYFLLKKIIGHWLIPILLCSQLYLFFRIAYRFAKLSSLELINREHDLV